MVFSPITSQPIKIGAFLLVESREGIILRPSHLDPCLRLSPHTAPDKLDFSSLARVDMLVAAMVDCY